MNTVQFEIPTNILNADDIIKIYRGNGDVIEIKASKGSKRTPALRRAQKKYYETNKEKFKQRYKEKKAQQLKEKENNLFKSLNIKK